jgi:NAD(P)H-hydrate epimerase
VIPVVSRDQIRAFDRHAIDVCRVPSLVLMENAGRGATELVARRLEERPGPVAVVCGPGNNGGDGFVVARLLRMRGRDVTVLFASHRDRLTGDALANHDAFVGLGGNVVMVDDANVERFSDELRRSVLVVDALLGTGLDRDVSGLFAALIERMNEANRIVIALDIPSGLDANTGVPHGRSVAATETVTFACLKLGLVTSSGAARAGNVTVADIGVPRSLVDHVGTSARLLEESDVSRWVSPRPIDVHKGGAGHVVVVAGSPGKTGAALLVARGALRTGAGLVTICTFPDAADAVDQRVLEEMTARIDPSRLEASLDDALKGASAVAVGPGLGHSDEARRVVEHVVLAWDGLKVVDADALTHFAGRLDALRAARGRLVLTPHPGEMGRLLGIATADVEKDRFGALARAVDRSGAVVLLKGARTLIGAPGELPVVNPTGTPALATAGSGDTLSGIIAALVASLDDPFRAACLGAFVHGRAGEHWAAESGADRGLLAHEIADKVPGVLAALTRARTALPL